MNNPTYKYDEESDSLSINFAPGEHATGIELNDHILLRINKAERRAVGLTLFNYSVLAQPTEFGSRSLPLTGLESLLDDTRQIVLGILQSSPVCDVLLISGYAPVTRQMIPIAMLRSLAVSKQAA